MQNLEPAAHLGIHTIHYQSAPQLAEDLRNLGVKFKLKGNAA
jgi:hypothetical protein